jgi:hypothetical protein
MGKDETTEKYATAKSKGAKEGDKETDASAETKKKPSEEDESSDSDSSSELEPARTKKGEPSDNLRRRSEWFQKRHGGR